MNDADYNKPLVRSSSVDEKKRAEKVVKGSVKTKPKGAAHKFADVFLAEDVSNVKSFIFMDVMIPAAKKLIMDIVTNGLGMLLGGGGERRSSSTNASYVSYRDYSSHKDESRFGSSERGRIGYSYNDIIFETRTDAEEVLLRLEESLDRYHIVTVLDLYDFAGLPSTHTDKKYGWVSLRNADICRVQGGYMLRLPKARPID